jgi:hypothetical protein
LARQFSESPTFYLLPLSEDDLARVAAQHERIFAVSRMPADSSSAWLDRNAYRSGSDWFGDLHLATYGTAADLTEYVSGARFGRIFVLPRYTLPDGPLTPGDVLPVALTWQADETPGGRFKVFAHLLNGAGQLVAQYDGEPVGGVQPTTDWAAGDSVTDRRGVLLPADLSAGAYTLVIGWYPADGGDRLPVVSASDEPIGTQLVLGTIQVVERQP